MFFHIPLPKKNTHCLVAPCGCKCVYFPFLLVSKQFETCLLPKLAPSNASYLSTTSIIPFHPQTLGQQKTICSNNSHVSGRSGSPRYCPGLYRYDHWPFLQAVVCQEAVEPGEELLLDYGAAYWSAPWRDAPRDGHREHQWSWNACCEKKKVSVFLEVGWVE